jgi:8-amino-7-oxononanoate synthase
MTKTHLSLLFFYTPQMHHYLLNTTLHTYLEKRKIEQTFRMLYSENNLIDFSSNDYLGLAKAAWIKQQINNDLHQNYTCHKTGATGSRLLSGNSVLYEMLEKDLAQFHHAEAALLFNSGYNANVGLIATVARKNDLIIYDELAHASILQAVKLSDAAGIKFWHNDTEHLEKLLQENKNKYRHIFIVTESVFSMDGDIAPLQTIAAISRRHHAALIVDEAHATGIYGEKGAGICNELGIEQACFARVYTFGKALGAHGAAVAGSRLLKDYLINFSKPFIYSTALSLYDLLLIKQSYKFIQQFDYPLNKLKNNIIYFKKQLSGYYSDKKIIGAGPIFALITENSDTCRKAAKHLQNTGFDIKPIVYPTVPQGKERLRIIIHSFNTLQEIRLLANSIIPLLKNLEEV